MIPWLPADLSSTWLQRLQRFGLWLSLFRLYANRNSVFFIPIVLPTSSIGNRTVAPWEVARFLWERKPPAISTLPPPDASALATVVDIETGES